MIIMLLRFYESYVSAQTDTPRRAKKRRSAEKAANIVSSIFRIFRKC